MKALILGAGFGTRLEKDLKTDTSGHYSDLIGVPKPLLPIANQPLATHWMHMINASNIIEDTFVITNGANHEAFVQWAKNWKKVKLVTDGALSNETRSGAVACMALAVDSFEDDSDLLVIAGDTLFKDDFDLSEVITRFQEYKNKDNEANMLVYVTCTDEEVNKYGILETNSENKVTGFLEKPLPSETCSRKECPCFYMLNKESLRLLKQFLEEKKDKPLRERDATGNFIAYLYKRKPVYATEISGRFDVGGLQSYIICDKYFTRR